MRVVFDTNVLVSALLFEESMPAQAFFFAVAKEAKNGRFPPVCTEALPL
ncbi:MAG: PIN domain-containing protein [Anaerolineales bacterium]|jgi:predicted nucleic acid-binding protein|nr:PIN domain-containing protein [Anaerolineales bacterium]WKZ51645.1 MAG: PIN domain-containing protein [Anaerolineales bacterium]